MTNESRGTLFESYISLKLHKENCPVALSSMLLREYGCGQVDVALRINGIIVIIEAKAHGLSIKAAQRTRLKKSAVYLGQLFNCPVRALLARAKDLQNKVTFINLF